MAKRRTRRAGPSIRIYKRGSRKNPKLTVGFPRGRSKAATLANARRTAKHNLKGDALRAVKEYFGKLTRKK